MRRKIEAGTSNSSGMGSLQDRRAVPYPAGPMRLVGRGLPSRCKADPMAYSAVLVTYPGTYTSRSTRSLPPGGHIWSLWSSPGLSPGAPRLSDRLQHMKKSAGHALFAGRTLRTAGLLVSRGSAQIGELRKAPAISRLMRLGGIMWRSLRQTRSPRPRRRPCFFPCSWGSSSRPSWLTADRWFLIASLVIAPAMQPSPSPRSPPTRHPAETAVFANLPDPWPCAEAICSTWFAFR